MRYSNLFVVLLFSALLYGAESDTTIVPVALVDALKKTHGIVDEKFTMTDGVGVARTVDIFFKHSVTNLLPTRPALLISLLKEDSPRVYLRNQWVDPYLPETKALTRELTSFEKTALEQLKKGEVLVAKYLPADSPKSEIENKIGGPIIEALGSIRARKNCLECHKVETGALLGAFTYRISESLVKMPKADRPKADEGIPLKK